MIDIEKRFDCIMNRVFFKENDVVNIMVSGGSDSMFLLTNVLRYFRENYSNLNGKYLKNFIKLNVIYIHFKDFESCEKSKQVVENFYQCYKKEINELIVINESSIDIDFDGNIKITAREEMKKHALENNPDYVITGHHKDDQIETILYRFFSGRAGIYGLKGMDEITNIYYKVKCAVFIKPMLEISKKEVIEYNKKYAIEYVDDETNFTNDADRNFIRNQIIPLIGRRFNINNIIRTSRRICDFIEEKSKNGLDISKNEWSLEDFKTNTLDNQIVAIVHAAKRLGYPLNRKVIRNLKNFLSKEFRTSIFTTKLYTINIYEHEVLFLVWNDEIIRVAKSRIE